MDNKDGKDKAKEDGKGKEVIKAGEAKVVIIKDGVIKEEIRAGVVKVVIRDGAAKATKEVGEVKVIKVDGEEDIEDKVVGVDKIKAGDPYANYFIINLKIVKI